MGNKIVILTSLICINACSVLRLSRQDNINNFSNTRDFIDFSLVEELKILENELSDDEYLEYQMVRSRLNGVSGRIYFLKLTKKEKKIYLTYIFHGQMPVVKRTGILNGVF